MSEPVQFQPKGSMCMACVNRFRDCSGLPFRFMPVIERNKWRSVNVNVVRCTEFKGKEQQG